MLSNWHRRFWLGGAALAILLITAVAMNPWLPSQKQIDPRSMGLDFIAFYTAGTFARQGRVSDLYDLATVHEFQQKLAAENHLDLQNTAPWWNPPIFAAMFEPLSALTFDSGYWTWLAINVFCLAGAIYLLMSLLPLESTWLYRGLIPLLVCVSMPAIQALGHAQNSAISLLILSAGFKLLQKNRPLLAGAIIGLLSYKPQIALATALILGLGMNRRLWLGFAAVAGGFLLLNALALPGTLHQYVAHLGENLQAIQLHQTYIWERQVTLGGFYRLLFQGRSAAPRSALVAALTITSQVILVVGLAFTWLRCRRADSLSPDFTIAALTAMPLLMPYFLDYDLLLLALPATLFAVQNMKRPPTMAIILWAALFICLWINPGLGRLTHFNLAVPVLCAAAMAMMLRSPAAKILAEPELEHSRFVPRLAA